MHIKLSSQNSLLLLFLIILPHRVTAIVHDDSFFPDAILRVTVHNISLGGIQKLTTLVNGSIPGPELRVSENETAWIRVYNDMEDQNLTMVSRMINQMVPFLMLFNLIERNHPALAWTRNGCLPIFRWNTPRQSMAHTPPVFLRL